MIIVNLISFVLLTHWTHGILGAMIYRKNIPDIAVLENVTVGSIVLSDIRTHLGLSPNTAIKLGPGSLNQFFRLNSETGELICTNTVDLESLTLCKVEKSCCRTEVNGQVADSTSDKPISSNNLEHTSSDFQLRLSQDGRLCRLMAFILASTVAETQLAPITQLHVTIVDLNDNAPTFSQDSSTGPNHLATTQPREHPSVKIAFLEGSGGLHGSQDLPMAYDADFSILNRVARYWLEWDKSAIESETSLEGRSASIRLNTAFPTDAQSGLTWAILGPFRLTYLSHGRSIALELDSELDRESVSQYHILLVAEDGGGLQGRLHIVVDVIDVNEFPPVFVDPFAIPNKISTPTEQEVYHKYYKVPESLSVGSEIGQLQAVDLDKSPENVIIYRLGSGTPQSKISKTFHLHSTTGSLTLLQPLDYETTRSYRLTVVAQDGTNADLAASSNQMVEKSSHTVGRLSATAIVEISVTDVNDNAPFIRFEKAEQINTASDFAQRLPTPFHHEVWIKEDVNKGSPVTFFSVTDNDSGENSRVSCSLMNWTDKFQLREFSGLHGLETVGEFDRETADNYYLTIRCQDHGTPIQQTDAIIAVHIEDVNDLPPTFELPLYQFHVLENSPIGTRLLPLNANYPSAVSAKDPDVNTTLHYHLEATDNDPNKRGSNRKGMGVDHSMDHLLFHIDPDTAVITTQGELDREIRDRLSFQVCADDGKHSAFTDVVVFLDDVNDNRPAFDRDTYVLRVEENQLWNSPLVVFKVTDADVDNQGFTFDFVEDAQPVMSVPTPPDTTVNQSDLVMHQNQPEPGTVRYHFALRENMLYLRRALDRELRSSYHFFIKATDIHNSKRSQDFSKTGILTDNGAQQLTSQAEIFVDVGDVNDNAPVLFFPNSTGPIGNRLIVSCHETMGSSVGRLQASDADLGQNASVVFSVIHTPEVDQLFYLDGQSGELFVNTGQLLAKCGSSVIMVISVDDLGTAESKRARTTPVERLIIKLEDKPTLAELIAAEARSKLGHLSNAGSFGRNGDGSDNANLYGMLSTRTVLSVVLGGSTVFLIGLLLVWLILLLYNRSRRQKRLARVQAPQNKPRYDRVSGSSGLHHQRTPEKVYLGPPQLVNQSDDLLDEGELYRERPTTWNTFKSEKLRDPDSTFQKATVPIDQDYHRCSSGGPDPDYIQSRNATYSRLSKPAFPSGTVHSRSSPTTTVTTALPPELQSDYMTAMWQLDGAENYQMCPVDITNPSNSCLGNSKKAETKFTTPTSLNRRRGRSSKIKRFFTSWILDNVLQRSREKNPVSPIALPNTLANRTQTIFSTQSPSLTRNYSAQSGLLFSASRDAEKSATCLRSQPGNGFRPGSTQLVYATLRRSNIKPVTYVPVTLNNQGATVSQRLTTHTQPFFTPPAVRRCNQPQQTDDRTDSSGSPGKQCSGKNEYTSLVKDTQCSANDRDSFSLNSIYPSHSLRTFLPHQSTGSQNLNTQPSTDGLIPDSTLHELCPKEMVYPCCCPSCEPLLATWVNYEGTSGGRSGSDSTRTCPQCHALDVPVCRGSSCCSANCQKTFSATPICMEDQIHANTDLSRQVDGQCSTNALSVQDILNSCV